MPKAESFQSRRRLLRETRAVWMILSADQGLDKVIFGVKTTHCYSSPVDNARYCMKRQEMALSTASVWDLGIAEPKQFHDGYG